MVVKFELVEGLLKVLFVLDDLVESLVLLSVLGPFVIQLFKQLFIVHLLDEIVFDLLVLSFELAILLRG